MKVSASAVSDDGAAKSQYQAAPKEAAKQQSSGNADLDEMLAKCQGGENKRETRECEKVIKDEYKLKTYQNSGEKLQANLVIGARIQSVRKHHSTAFQKWWDRRRTP